MYGQIIVTFPYHIDIIDKSYMMGEREVSWQERFEMPTVYTLNKLP